MFLLTTYYVIFYMCLLFTLWRMNEYQSTYHWPLVSFYICLHNTPFQAICIEIQYSK